MKKLVSSVLAFLFIGSTGIPVSASSPDGDQRPSISVIDSNSDFQKLNIEGYHLEPGERIVTEKDYLGLPKDNGEAVILDINNKIKGFIKYELADTNARKLTGLPESLGCIAGIAALIGAAITAVAVGKEVVAAVAAFGLEAVAYCYYEVVAQLKDLKHLTEMMKKAVSALLLIINLPENCSKAFS